MKMELSAFTANPSSQNSAGRAVDSSLTVLGERDFAAFRSLIHQHTGIWLRDGKEVMLASRLSRRVRLLGLDGFGDYLQYLTRLVDNREEMRELINCVTTNKTSFFRERHHFNYLATTVVPETRASRQIAGANRIRIWSAASSTGEEPYSIAMTLLEALQKEKGRIPSQSLVEIVASDVDTSVLATAQRAIYRLDALDKVPQNFLKRYFLRGKDAMSGYAKVKSEVTDLVDFTRINLMDAQWEIEGPFDVIFFRNALIYFQRETQDRFLRRMIRYLRPGGYLFLGNSEHIPWLHDILAPLNQTMYRLREPKNVAIQADATQGESRG